MSAVRDRHRPPLNFEKASAVQNVKAVIFFKFATSLAVVLMGLGIMPRAAIAQDMTFRTMSMAGFDSCQKNCPELIVAEGEIADSTPQAFLNFIKQNSGNKNLRSVVFLQSPGGKVAAAMKLGLVLRKTGAAAIVAHVLSQGEGGGDVKGFGSGRCFSACVYALIGAKKRVIPPESRVGIHRMFTLEAGRDPTGDSKGVRKQFDDGKVASALADYVAKMGVSRDLVDYAEQVAPDKIHIVTPAEIARWRLGSPKL